MDSDYNKDLLELSQLMKKAERVDEEEQKLSLGIINSVREGTVPEHGIELFSVGRKDILNIIENDLNKIMKGRSKLKFINGEYGSGKTHLLYLLKEIAFRHNYVTSFVTLTPRECPLFDLARVYNFVIQGLRTNTCKHTSALEIIIKDWSNKIKDLGIDDRINALTKIKRLSSDFQNVLTYYLKAIQKNLGREADLSIRWIKGELTTLREARVMEAQNYASDSTVLDMLQNIVKMLRIVGYSGLIILLDETESSPSVLSTRNVKRAFDNLNRLINCNLNTAHLYFLYAITPKFISEWQDIGIPIEVGQNTIDLDPLGEDSLTQLALYLRDLHLISYPWSNIARISDSSMYDYVTRYRTELQNRGLAREFVRTLISSLDVCQQNVKIQINQSLHNGSNK